ncbi:hypothetical protein CSUI_002730 [Cystoisospora suis]|uniref:Uncharacterized protein n=1 Tax=Cystoisospora suis TaxID=483139 RepID=A0A2C6L887_9APIC|nr:hypothetical protein CSUI_002730 [Cystoisospora suis]
MAAGVEQLLADMRKQFDDVHMEVLKQTADFTRFKEGIRQADSAEQLKEQDMTRLSDSRTQLLATMSFVPYFTCVQRPRQLENISCRFASDRFLFPMITLLQKEQEFQGKLQDMNRRIDETNATRKVYRHILDRTKKEKELLRQRILKMQEKARNYQHELREKQRLMEHKLCQWQQTVVKDAAAAAFSASSGRWRRMYGMEKLIANALQKITVEEVEKSQNTEDTFQKIREATGLDDVMDIVQKFLNKDMEHEQLRRLAADAEARLEAAEARDETLNRAVKQHVASVDTLRETTMQLDHAKQWASRINAVFVAADLEEPFVCESVEGLVRYIASLQKETIPRLIALLDIKKTARPLSAPASCQPLSEAPGLLVNEPGESPAGAVQGSLQYRRRSSEPSEISHASEHGSPRSESLDQTGLDPSAHRQVVPLAEPETEEGLDLPATQHGWPRSETEDVPAVP